MVSALPLGKRHSFRDLPRPYPPTPRAESPSMEACNVAREGDSAIASSERVPRFASAWNGDRVTVTRLSYLTMAALGLLGLVQSLSYLRAYWAASPLISFLVAPARTNRSLVIRNCPTGIAMS